MSPRQNIQTQPPGAPARLVLVRFAALSAAAALLATCAAPAAAAEGCANEARRVEQSSTFLPDCRAYELVSQPYQPTPEYWKYSDGYPPNGGTDLGLEEPLRLPAVQFGEFTAADGEAAIFEGSQPNSEGDGLATNLSRRTQDGWVGENLETYARSRHSFICNPVGYAGFSENLESIVWYDGEGGPLENKKSAGDAADCGYPEFGPGELEPEEPLPLEAGSLFLRDTATGRFKLLNPTPPGTAEYRPWFDAISADGSHVVFQTRAQLTPNAPDAEAGCELGDVYVWSASALHLLTVLPNGEPVRGTLAGAYPGGCGELPYQSAGFTDSVSADGERILFYAGGGFAARSYIDGRLYLREHPGAEEASLSHECTEAEQTAEPEKACTLQIDLPNKETGVAGSGGGGQFQWANAQTTRIFFTDEEKLTSTATAKTGKPDLYEYDLEKPEGQRLTDLTENATEAADVLGVSGASEDGSYVYFAAQSVLTGTQQNSHGATALGPAQGTGEVNGGGEATGEFLFESANVTNVKVTSGEFFVGQELESTGATRSAGFVIPERTTVTSCSPSCSAPTELIVSKKMGKESGGSVSFIGYGHSQVTGVSTSSGAFEEGMAVSGTGIRPNTWIEAVGNGTLTLSKAVAVEASGAQTLSATAANLYMRDGGTTTFIASLNAEGGDQCDWTAHCLTSRVSQNGKFIAFDSIDELTGYDNHPVHPESCELLTKTPESPCMEAFRYAVEGGVHGEGELTCATCKPSGAPPAAEFGWAVIAEAYSGLYGGPIRLNNAVSDSGEVFFETMEKLVEEDENETWDVYEYEGGEGPTAQYHLISTGESELPSFFVNATPDGSNVFFLTGQSLLRADTRADYDLYDARVNGGFASQDEVVTPPSCEVLEACRSPLSEAPAELSVASAELQGPGNLVGKPQQHEVKKHAKKCRKGFVGRNGKCVRKHKHAHSKRKHHGKHARHSGRAGR